MSAPRLAAAIASASISAFLLVACAPAPTAPTASALSTPGLVAPAFSPARAGSPLAPGPVTPTPTSDEPVSPFPDKIDGYETYKTTQGSDGVVVAYFLNSTDASKAISASLVPSSKTDAQLQGVIPGSKRIGEAWCGTDPTDGKGLACVAKVGATRGVVAFGDGVDAEELGRLTTDLAASV